LIAFDLATLIIIVVIICVLPVTALLVFVIGVLLDRLPKDFKRDFYRFKDQ
jgi:hypothetical protein